MRALLTGASGQLGAALQQQLGDRVVRAARRDELDVRDAAAVRQAVLESGADVIVNASAYNNVDAAETEPAEAFAVNAAGPHHLARAALESGALLVHVSTDYVFDGESRTPYVEQDCPRPRSVYGASKLAGEQLAARAAGLVVRTSGVYGAGGSRAKGGSFVERVLRRARAGEPLRVVDDQVFSPTYACDLAAGIIALIEHGARGLVHLSNAGRCSWHELATVALNQAGIDVPVERIRASELRQAATRPAFSVLENRHAHVLGVALRPWQEALSVFLNSQKA